MWPSNYDLGKWFLRLSRFLFFNVTGEMVFRATQAVHAGVS
jgi:hypothetical protein